MSSNPVVHDTPSPELLTEPPTEPAVSLPEAQESILVLDFGSQTAQLIARRVREQNGFCQLVRHNISAERIRELKPRGLILSGSPASVYGTAAPHPDPEIFNLGIPVLIPELPLLESAEARPAPDSCWIHN